MYQRSFQNFFPIRNPQNAKKSLAKPVLANSTSHTNLFCLFSYVCRPIQNNMLGCMYVS